MNIENQFTGGSEGYVESEEKIILIPDDRKVIIKNVVCRSEDLYYYLENGSNIEDPIEALNRALECGAAVLNRVAFRDDRDYLENLTMSCFTTLEATMKEYIQANLDPSEQGTLAKRVHDLFRVQHSEMTELINKGELHAVEFEKQLVGFIKSIQDVMQSALGKVMSDDQTGVWVLLREIKNEIQTLRDKVVADATKAVSSAHVKGVAFEDEVFSIINNWAQNFQGQGANVVVEDVRAVTGPLGKQGDMLIRLLSGGECRICVEAKSQEIISTAKILDVCNAAKENRGADFIIYVASDQQNLPAEIGEWAQFDNRIITSTAGFNIALKIATCQLLLKKAKEQTGSIDVEKGLSLLQEIDDQMKKFGILLSCTRATAKNAQKAQETALSIREKIEAATEQLVSLLSSTSNVKKESI